MKGLPGGTATCATDKFLQDILSDARGMSDCYHRRVEAIYGRWKFLRDLFGSPPAPAEREVKEFIDRYLNKKDCECHGVCPGISLSRG